MQEIAALPESADFYMCDIHVVIRNHKFDGSVGSFFETVMGIIQSEDSNIQTLSQFEDYGISFEGVIEYCAAELEDVPKNFGAYIWLYVIERSAFSMAKYNTDLPTYENFSNSESGLAYAQEFTNKIRNCKNWGELYDEMHPGSKFSIDIMCRILKEFGKK